MPKNFKNFMVEDFTDVYLEYLKGHTPAGNNNKENSQWK